MENSLNIIANGMVFALVELETIRAENRARGEQPFGHVLQDIVAARPTKMHMGSVLGQPDPRNLRTAVGDRTEPYLGHLRYVVEVERVDARAPGGDRKKPSVGNLEGERDGQQDMRQGQGVRVRFGAKQQHTSQSYRCTFAVNHRS